MGLDSRVEQLEHDGRKIELTREFGDLHAEVNYGSIADYLSHYESVRRFLERDFDTRKIFGVPVRRHARLDTYITSMIDSLTIDDMRDSAYVREDVHSSVDTVSDHTRRVPITRRDFVLTDESGILNGYLELSTYTDPEAWNHAVYSEKGDLVSVGVSEPISNDKPPLVIIYDFTNKYYAERLLSKQLEIR